MAENTEGSEWETLKEIDIPGGKEGTGIIVRIYRKVGEKVPRVGLTSYYTKDGKKSYSKGFRIENTLIEKVASNLKQIDEVIKKNYNG